MINIKRIVFSLIIIIGLAAAVSCSGSTTTSTTPPSPSTTSPATTSPITTVTTLPVDIMEVTIEDYEYIPETITVPPGTTVTWTNLDSVQHTVTERNGLFNSDLFGRNETFSYLFTEPGSYEYYCIPHPYMVGTVIVQ